MSIDELVGTSIESPNSRYTYVDLIGEGTFAHVYLVEDEEGEQFCLKKIKDFGDWKAYDLAKREAEVLEQNPHTGSPAFHEFFEDGLKTYLVMEFVEGKNLKSLIESGRRFTESEIIDIEIQVLGIMGDYHDKDIIHRDLKPSNLIINEDGRVRIIDWGSVKFDSVEGSTVAGTSGYAPFETFCGKAVPASDIFSLGRTMIYLASALDPLKMDENGGGEVDFKKHVETRLSQDFCDILEKSCRMLPNDRYQSTEEVLDAIRKIDLSSRLKELGKGVKYDGSKIFIPDVEKLDRALEIARDIGCETVRVPVLADERRDLHRQYQLTDVNESYGISSDGVLAKMVRFGKVLSYPLLGSLPKSLQKELEKRLNNGQKANFNGHHASIASGVFELVAGAGSIAYSAITGDPTGYYVGGGLVGEALVRRRLSIESKCGGCPASIVCPGGQLGSKPKNEPVGTLVGKVALSPVEYVIKKSTYDPKKLVDVSATKLLTE